MKLSTIKRELATSRYSSGTTRAPFLICWNEIISSLPSFNEVLESICTINIEVDEEGYCDHRNLNEQCEEICKREEIAYKIIDDSRDIYAANLNGKTCRYIAVVQPANETREQDIRDGETKDVKNDEEDGEDVAGGNVQVEHDGKGKGETGRVVKAKERVLLKAVV